MNNNTMGSIIIHRGTHTIGGSCIEVSCDSHRIIFDFGLPLMGRDGAALDEKALNAPSIENGILPNVTGLYKHQTPAVDAVILSHPHIDHYGLAEYIHPDIPVYLSRGVQTLIDVGNIFYPKATNLQNVKNFNHYKPFFIGPFKITSLLADHSGFDASSFLVEAEGKKIFYTGDLRGHGRKGKLLEQLINQPPKDIDCMLMEGTTLGGKHKGSKTEEEVEEELFKIFSKQTDMSFVYASGSNVDRLVSLYKATLRSKKIFVLDIYTFYLLEQLKKLGAILPPFKDDNIKIYFLKSHADAIGKKVSPELLYSYVPRRIKIDEIIKDRQHIVLKLPINRSLFSIARRAESEKSLTQAKFIYSMWSGYLEKNKSIEKLCNEFHLDFVKIHTSGHAYLEDLQRLANAINPKTLIPIHTLSGDDFHRHFENVVRLDDGIPFEIK